MAMFRVKNSSANPTTDTDTFSICYQATTAGKDKSGKEYAVDDWLLELASGDIICLGAQVPTFKRHSDGGNLTSGDTVIDLDSLTTDYYNPIYPEPFPKVYRGTPEDCGTPVVCVDGQLYGAPEHQSYANHKRQVYHAYPNIDADCKGISEEDGPLFLGGLFNDNPANGLGQVVQGLPNPTCRQFMYQANFCMKVTYRVLSAGEIKFAGIFDDDTGSSNNTSVLNPAFTIPDIHESYTQQDVGRIITKTCCIAECYFMTPPVVQKYAAFNSSVEVVEGKFCIIATENTIAITGGTR